MIPATSKLVISITGQSDYTLAMNNGWSIDIAPHAAKFKVAQGELHAYANKKNDWTKNSGTKIAHADGRRIGRIVITDPIAGTKIKDIPCLLADKCEIVFTIGK